jgi:hypothetical protein
MKASDLLVRCLEEEGVEYIFGVPGEENADFIWRFRHPFSCTAEGINQMLWCFAAGTCSSVRTIAFPIVA